MLTCIFLNETRLRCTSEHAAVALIPILDPRLLVPASSVLCLGSLSVVGLKEVALSGMILPFQSIMANYV